MEFSKLFFCKVIKVVVGCQTCTPRDGTPKASVARGGIHPRASPGFGGRLGPGGGGGGVSRFPVP